MKHLDTEQIALLREFAKWLAARKKVTQVAKLSQESWDNAYERAKTPDGTPLPNAFASADEAATKRAREFYCGVIDQFDLERQRAALGLGNATS